MFNARLFFLKKRFNFFLNIHLVVSGFILCVEIIGILVQIFHTEFAAILHSQCQSLSHVYCQMYVQVQSKDL